MNTLMDDLEMASENFYYTIIEKLNATLATYNHVAEINQCGQSFDALDLASYSKDAQVNHLLSITNCLLKHVPNSPLLDELFTNFLKDYIHLVNPEMPKHVGELYLKEEFVRKCSQVKKISRTYKSNTYKVSGLWN